MVNYGNGKVYKIEPIVEHDEGDIYIGSTTKQYLSQRMEKHRYNYKYWKEGKTGKLMSFILFEKYGVENCNIILLENVNAKSKDELTAREAEFIKIHKCVNKFLPFQTIDERKEKQRSYRKLRQEKSNKEKEDFYNEHKDEIEATRIEKIKHSQQKYRNKHKSEIAEKAKMYREENKEKIKQQKAVKEKCPHCDLVLLKRCMALHIKRKHLN